MSWNRDDDERRNGMLDVDDGVEPERVARQPAPGKVTLTGQLLVPRRTAPVQRSARGATTDAPASQPRPAMNLGPYESAMFGLTSALPGAAVQLSRDNAQPDAEAVKQAAQQGVQGSAQPLPHLETIQASFGKHDISGVEAHIGGPAHRANQSMGARAYASGNKVAFSGQPDMHTAAHEAAHIVQQRHGVSLKSDVGQANDQYERHADQVADRVVRGQSAEDLLDARAGGTAPGVQRLANVVQMVLEAGDLQPDEENKILLLGEGNFSFALSLAKQLKNPKSMVATSYDSEEEVKGKYQQAGANIDALGQKGATVEHGVDARSITGTYQHIVFNFPWTPEETRGGTTNNKALLQGFFASAAGAVMPGGHVFLTLANKKYYAARWKPVELAQAQGFTLVREEEFDSSEFPGYEHRQTLEDRSAASTESESGTQGVTFIFTRAAS